MSRTWAGSGTALQLFGVDQHLLLAVLILAGVASGVIIALALVALARRRTWSYFLVTFALATLLARTFLGGLVHLDRLGSTPHHVLEHALDILAVVLLLGAIYCARTAGRTEGGIRE